MLSNWFVPLSRRPFSDPIEVFQAEDPALGCACANSKLMIANSVRSHSGGGEMSRPPEACGSRIRADQRHLVFEILEIEIHLDAPLYKREHCGLSVEGAYVM